MVSETSNTLIRTFFVGEKKAEINFNRLEGLVAKVQTQQGLFYIPSYDIEGIPLRIKKDPVVLKAFFEGVNITINASYQGNNPSYILRVNFPLKGGGNGLKTARREYADAQAQDEKKFFIDAISKYKKTIQIILEEKKKEPTSKKEIKLNTILRDSYFSLALCLEQMDQLQEALQNFKSASDYGKDTQVQMARITAILEKSDKPLESAPINPNIPQVPSVVKKVTKQNLPLTEVLISIRDKVLADESTKRLNDIYTPLKCVNTPGIRSIEERSTDLFQNFEDFMQGDKKVFLVLGEAGGGKSYFLQNVEKMLWEKFDPSVPNSVIPIRIELGTLTNPVFSAVSEHLSHKNFTEIQIQELKHKHRVLIILDGYDDARFNEVPLDQNLFVTNKLKEWNGKVIIAGRLDASEILNPLLPDHLKKFSPVNDGVFRDDLVEEVFICPFFPSQIETYIEKSVEKCNPVLRSKYPNWFENPKLFKRTIAQSQSLKALVRTPFILRSIIEGLPRINLDLNGPIGKFQIYKAFTEGCFEREEVKFVERGQSRPDSLSKLDLKKLANDFCKDIAIMMIESDICTITYNESDPQAYRDWEHYFGNSEEAIFLRTICSDVIRKSGTVVEDRILEQYYFVHLELRDYFQSV